MVANVAPTPPPGGLTAVVAGTTDVQALVDAQPFLVESAWKLDIATQQWLSFVVGAPVFANSLTALAPTEVVTLRSAPETNLPVISLADCYNSQEIVVEYAQVRECIEPLFLDALGVDVPTLNYTIAILGEDSMNAIVEEQSPGMPSHAVDAFTAPGLQRIYIRANPADEVILGLGREILVAYYLRHAPGFLRSGSEFQYVGETMSSWGASIAASMFAQRGMPLTPLGGAGLVDYVVERVAAGATDGDLFNMTARATWAIAMTNGYDGTSGDRWSSEESFQAFRAAILLTAEQLLGEMDRAVAQYHPDELTDLIRAAMVARLDRPTANANVAGEAVIYLP